MPEIIDISFESPFSEAMMKKLRGLVEKTTDFESPDCAFVLQVAWSGDAKGIFLPPWAADRVKNTLDAVVKYGDEGSFVEIKDDGEYAKAGDVMKDLREALERDRANLESLESSLAALKIGMAEYRAKKKGEEKISCKK